MLTDVLALIRTDRRALALALAFGILAGCGLGWTLDPFTGERVASGAAATGPTPTPSLGPPPPSRGKVVAPPAGGSVTSVETATPEASVPAADTDAQREVAAALRRGVKEANAKGG